MQYYTDQDMYTKDAFGNPIALVQQFNPAMTMDPMSMMQQPMAGIPQWP